MSEVFVGIVALIVITVAIVFWRLASSRSSFRETPAEPEREPRPVQRSRAPVAPVHAPRRHEAKKLFLSYRREDSADVTGRIYDRLTQAFEKTQVFKDVDSIPLGVDFRQHLQEVVSSCDVVLVVIGDRWLTTAAADGKRRLNDPKDFVRIELETALQREIPVIPVLVRGASVPEENGLPAALSALAYRNGIAIRSDPDFHRDMDRLIQSLKAHLSGTEVAS
jgi:hypothetical protein